MQDRLCLNDTGKAEAFLACWSHRTIVAIMVMLSGKCTCKGRMLVRAECLYALVRAVFLLITVVRYSLWIACEGRSHNEACLSESDNGTGASYMGGSDCKAEQNWCRILPVEHAHDLTALIVDNGLLLLVPKDGNCVLT